ncbi:DnaT-like ssDNA-binding domain-containing protein [Lamprocystis purpurea]|uniref:DnaT-like ssDNA-binding domain-containing protein n=1 Tax=Lamprocystis purpurea TaxID=61598 RepID=UPI002480DF76|nr:DnaT-like ssDNA-binding domain-containing protein [Lamprocystis purpurea]
MGCRGYEPSGDPSGEPSGVRADEKRRSRASRALRASPTKCPSDWEPDAMSQKWIESFGVTVEAARPAVLEFRGYWAERTTKRADWQSSFRKNGKVEGTLIRLRDAGSKSAGASFRASGPEPTGAAYRYFAPED